MLDGGYWILVTCYWLLVKERVEGRMIRERFHSGIYTSKNYYHYQHVTLYFLVTSVPTP
jgi:hypothetical protein